MAQKLAMSLTRLREHWFACCFAMLLLAPGPALADAGRLAFVEADGSLRLGQTIVRLYGIYIPPSERTCRTFVRPARCGSRAALALEQKIDGMVYCDAVSRNRDRSVNAVCEISSGAAQFGEREDLAAYLLRQGWAVALPGAPFAYHTLERIARTQGRGVWGFQADSVQFR